MYTGIRSIWQSSFNFGGEFYLIRNLVGSTKNEPYCMLLQTVSMIVAIFVDISTHVPHGTEVFRIVLSASLPYVLLKAGGRHREMM